MTTAASPAIQLSADGVTWGAPGAKLSVSAGATVYFRLDSIANVDSTTWQVITTDDSTTAGSFVLTLTGIATSAGSLVAGALGSALILQSEVNAGQDKTSASYNPLTTTATVKVWVPCAANGNEVVCYDEHGESGSQWWTPLVNAAIRAAASGAGNVPVTRTMTTTAPLTGGGDLSANRTFAISAATDSTAGSMSAADKTKLDAATATPTGGAVAEYDSNGNLVAKAVSYVAAAAPASPASGWDIYSDSGDGNRLKAKDSTGRVAYLVKTMLLSNSKTLTANNVPADVPVFGITGSIRVTKLYAVVTTVIGPNHTGSVFNLYDQSTRTPITGGTSGALSAASVGSLAVSVTNGGASPADICDILLSSAGAVGTPSVAPRFFSDLVLVQKHGAATNIEYHYATTDAPTSGVLQFWIEYEPLSADGAVAAL